jgi:Flp pilus assembly protein TadB
MDDTTSFDRQLGDIVWMIITGLRAGYNLKQVFEALSRETPEPAASVFKRLNADLGAGLGFDQAFANLKQFVPSKYLSDVLAVIQLQRQDWETANLLEPLSEEIVAQAGSDPALYTAMHRQAEILGANVPERARSSRVYPAHPQQ